MAVVNIKTKKLVYCLNFPGRFWGYSPEALLVGSDPNVYFVISEYQLSTGFEPAHFALGLEDQEQYRFSPYSWSEDISIAGHERLTLVAKDLETVKESRKNWNFHFDLQLHPTVLNGTYSYCQIIDFIPAFKGPNLLMCRIICLLEQNFLLLHFTLLDTYKYHGMYLQKNQLTSWTFASHSLLSLGTPLIKYGKFLFCLLISLFWKKDTL